MACLPTSTYEQSGGRRTGAYAEALALAETYAAEFPEAIRLLRFGATAEGRPLVALVVGRGPGATDAAACRTARRPVLFFQAGIHPGEIEGKDAGFIFLREVLSGRQLPGALDRLTLVFVPTLNADGHERSSPNNRPNQRGPEEMGWRTTAQNLNLNRDYTKVDAPEMDAVLRLMQEWDPVLFCDVHATDGAQFEHDLSLLVDAASVAPEPLLAQGKKLRDGLLARLTQRGHTPVDFYPSLREEDRPESGFDLWVLAPRYSNGYWGAMRQRLSVLVETHSWRPYDYRVKTVLNIFDVLFELALEHGRAWLDAVASADADATCLGGRSVELTYAATDRARTIEFKGYAYERTLSPVSGRPRIRYDETRPMSWKVPYHDELRADCTVIAPRHGYVVPAAWSAALAPRLTAHGIVFERLTRAVTKARTQTFRAQRFKPAAAPFEGRTRLEVEGSWRDEPRDLPDGSLLVKIAQPRARLALHLFEPTAPDSFLAWGFFNGCFERKEHMEAYVCEAEAERMLRDPLIKAAFEEALRDPAFAASATRRLDFFYERHPSWDERFALYPVLRLEHSL
jgi:hypothetical protein